VLAPRRNENAADVRILARLDVEHPPPLHAGRRAVGLLAGGGAGLATHAAAQVRDHHAARHSASPSLPAPTGGEVLRTWTFTASAPEPVAPVSARDTIGRGATPSSEGTPRPFATGDFQRANC